MKEEGRSFGVEVTLGEVTDPAINQSGPDAVHDSFVYIDISSIDRDRKVITAPQKLPCSLAPSRAKQRVRAGDVLVSMTRPNLNAVAMVAENLDGAIASTGFHVLRSRWVSPAFLHNLVQSDAFVTAMCDVVQGALYPAVRPRDISSFKFFLPSSFAQQRTVQKLDELLPALDAGVAELKAAQKKLAQYRQSLLKAAVAGDLTADWREARKEELRRQKEEGRRAMEAPTFLPSSFDASSLLHRILQQRRERWQARQLAKFAEQGKPPPKGWQDKYPEPAAPNTRDLPALPEGWVWASLDQLVSESCYGTSVKCSYEATGKPVLRIPNVGGGLIDLGDMKFASADLELDQSDYLKVGDVLVIRTNGSIGLVGRAAAITDELPAQHYFASYLLRLRCVDASQVHRWVSVWLASSHGRQWIEERAASSAGQHNISLSTLLTMDVPLPSLAEQPEALALLEAALQSASVQRQALEHSLKQSTAQRQNILRAAFVGQLVPQDSSDEPASVLLERIRAERKAHPKDRRKGVNAPVRAELVEASPSTVRQAHGSGRTEGGRE